MNKSTQVRGVNVDLTNILKKVVNWDRATMVDFIKRHSLHRTPTFQDRLTEDEDWRVLPLKRLRSLILLHFGYKARKARKAKEKPPATEKTHKLNRIEERIAVHARAILLRSSGEPYGGGVGYSDAMFNALEYTKREAAFWGRVLKDKDYSLVRIEKHLDRAWKDYLKFMGRLL